ncbi:hypothetical protein GCM10027589_32660 [Actinocorallia lasiicapitis]
MIDEFDVAALAALVRSPSRGWLERCVGAERLWTPANPESYTEDAATARFLAEVGVPAVKLAEIRYDSADLLTKGPWKATPAEVFAGAYEDDADAPAYCHGLGEFGGQTIMLMPDGAVSVYDPGAWDFGEGLVDEHSFTGLAQVAGSVALLALLDRRLAEARTDPDPALRSLPALRTVLDVVEALGGLTESHFWTDRLEDYLDYFPTNGSPPRPFHYRPDGLLAY